MEQPYHEKLDWARRDKATGAARLLQASFNCVWHDAARCFWRLVSSTCQDPVQHQGGEGLSLELHRETHFVKVRINDAWTPALNLRWILIWVRESQQPDEVKVRKPLMGVLLKQHIPGTCAP